MDFGNGMLPDHCRLDCIGAGLPDWKYFILIRMQPEENKRLRMLPGQILFVQTASAVCFAAIAYKFSASARAAPWETMVI